MKEITDGDKIVAALQGIPVFCLGRVYSWIEGWSMVRNQFIFRFENGFGASVVEFDDKSFSNGEDYEIAVIELNNSSRGYTITYDTNVMPDVSRGNANRIDEILIKIEAL
jgi:hypothetical protein